MVTCTQSLVVTVRPLARRTVNFLPVPYNFSPYCSTIYLLIKLELAPESNKNTFRSPQTRPIIPIKPPRETTWPWSSAKLSRLSLKDLDFPQNQDQPALQHFANVALSTKFSSAQLLNLNWGYFGVPHSLPHHCLLKLWPTMIRVPRHHHAHHQIQCALHL